MALSPERAVPGQKFILRVNVSAQRPLSGLVFTLSYPVQALRLDDARSHQTLGLVPSTALTVWNVSPNQNEYSVQDGKISVAVSSDSYWAGSQGSVAEFAFTVQDGATNQYRWPLELSRIELANGLDLFSVLNTRLFFSGRDSFSPVLTTGANVGNGTFELSYFGEPNTPYRLEVSDDLKTWSQLTILVTESGHLTINDPMALATRKHFYRIVQLED